jgi:hypothetical protein
VIRRASLVLGLIAPCMAAATGCHTSAHTSAVAIAPDSVATAPDSLTGIVSITGTSFEQRIVLRNGNSVTSLSAATPESAALSRMGGIEVRVVGKQTPSMFQVDHFTALSVAGSPVADGILRNDDGRLALETTHGRLPLGNPPTALRGMIGARVWIAGPLDTGPNSYGVIARPR